MHAVGEATANAARDAGFGIASTGEAGVERLLGSIDSDQRLLHLCGADFRAVEAEQPIERRIVYRAVPAEADLSRLAGGRRGAPGRVNAWRNW